ncbi:kiSS-1 receptor-like [Ptychodera flava]|uniref:kiSS-1 receptor-like n=1 Tax=Ptychodera flava TaxID=63121 RepID=UPI00396A15CE
MESHLWSTERTPLLSDQTQDLVARLFNDTDSDARAITGAEERLLEAFILSLAVVVGSLGNASVVLAVVRHKPLRTKVRYLIASLALANFVHCFCILPMDVMSIGLGGWPLLTYSVN